MTSRVPEPLHDTARTGAFTAAVSRTGIVAAAAFLILGLGACDAQAPAVNDAPASAPEIESSTPAGNGAELPSAEIDGAPGDVATTPPTEAVGPPTSEAAAIATARIAELLPTQEMAFGVSGSSPGQMMLPFDVAVGPEGNIYLSDSTGVKKFSPDGEYLEWIGEGEVLTALGGLAVGPDGTVYVTGFESQVWAYGPDGQSRAAIGTPGSEPGQLSRPVDVAVDAAGSIYVADTENARVEKFAADGRHLMTFGGAGSGRGELRSPRAVAVDADGNVYIGEGDHFLVQRFTPDGEYLDAFGQGHADENIWRIGGLAVGDDGTVYATQAMSNRLQAFDPAADLALAWEFGSLGRSHGEFSSPMGLDVVGDRLYIADQQNNRIVIYALKQ
jgi:DNA-binding beta-propeller fold protein YncE